MSDILHHFTNTPLVILDDTRGCNSGTSFGIMNQALRMKTKKFDIFALWCVLVKIQIIYLWLPTRRNINARESYNLIYLNNSALAMLHEMYQTEIQP